MKVIGFTGASHAHNNLAASLKQAGAEAVFSNFAELPDLLNTLGVP
jgi:hypothetical protein